MEHISQITAKILTEAENNPLPKPPSIVSPQSKVATYDEKEKKSAIITQLAACLAVQRTYGKQAGELHTVVKIFLSDLSEYTGEKVAEAIVKWRKTRQEFPTPADIAGILNPQPRFDSAVYREMIERRKRNEERYSDAEYMRKYEASVIRGD